MSNGLFEVLASVDAAEQERVAATRAVIAAQTRAKQRFEKFVSAATNQEERDARITLIASDLDEVLTDVVAEHGSDLEMLRNAATVALGGGHAADCTCGFCKNKGKLPGSEKDDGGDADDDDDMDKESSVKTSKTCPECEKGQMHEDDHVWVCSKCGYETSEPDDDDDDERTSKTAKIDIKQASASAAEFPWEHVAADVETGDSFETERVDLPSNKTDGLGGPSPKIDKGKSGDEAGWDLKPIDVPSKAHPSEQQSVEDRADYTAQDFDPASPTRDRIDADKALQPEHNVADNTETWTGTEGQASPVTSAVLSKWTVLP